MTFSRMSISALILCAALTIPMMAGNPPQRGGYPQDDAQNTAAPQSSDEPGYAPEDQAPPDQGAPDQAQSPDYNAPQGQPPEYPPQQGEQNYPPPQQGEQNYPPQQGEQNYPPPQQGEQNYPPPQRGEAPPPEGGQRLATVPAGTVLSVRLIDPLDSETAKVGDVFHGTLNAPVRLDGYTVVPFDADVTGRVVDVQSAGRFKGAALLTIELTRLKFNGHSYALQTEEWSRQLKGRGKESAAKVGGGAALGAIIGGIAGGGKGAAIGTVVGGGAGATAQGVTKEQQIKLEPESQLTFRLDQPVTVQPAARNRRNVGRRRLD